MAAHFTLCPLSSPDVVLPVPTLILQQQTDVWHLLCTGSPAYPGAVFYLYRADNEFPVATHPTTLIHHQATFPVPVQDTPMALYRCQYSVHLGKKWSSSELSLPLAVTRGADLKLFSMCVCVCLGNRTRNVTLFLFSHLTGIPPPPSRGSWQLHILFHAIFELMWILSWRET